MDWEKASSSDETIYQIPRSWLLIHYYEALNLLFRFENSLRVFIYIILKIEFKEKWSDVSVSSNEGAGDGTIASIAKKRISQAKNFGYLGYSIINPIMHLTSGELINLITSESYWKFFSQYFPGSKEIIKNKLNEIGIIRNSLAHFRPIKKDDVEVIKQNTKQTLMLVDKCFSEIFRCHNIIPTNATDDWYKNFETLGTKNCKFNFYQSKDENWIRISLNYNCPILKSDGFLPNFKTYYFLNIITPAILLKFQNIKNAVIYISEDIPYTNFNKDLPELSKNISFVFYRRILEDCFSELKEFFEDMLRKISEETELINQDNLAKGDIIEVSSAAAIFKKTEWQLNPAPLYYNLKENDPPEYWGQLLYFHRDFISMADIYPWMPERISLEAFPF